MKSRMCDLKKRGFINDKFMGKYSDLGYKKLETLLQSEKPQERTVAAKISGIRTEHRSIPKLCNALSIEKSLYSKIAMSESLGIMGKKAIPYLIKLLGSIGNNQHKYLPTKPFEKLSYPLPRDIIARTITKIGKQALPYLEKVILLDDIQKTSEAIDSIGYISFYTKTNRSLNALLNSFNKHKENEIIVWKILRAFSSFNDKKVLTILKITIKNSEVPSHQWEAKRSLFLLQN